MSERLKLPSFPKGVLASLQKNLGARVIGALKVLFLDTESVMSPALLLEEWARKDPEHPFLVFEGTSLTYGEAWTRIAKRAGTLRAEGVRWGDVVALVMANAPEYIIDVLALSALGATASLINTSLSGASLLHVLKESTPRAIIAGRDFCETIDEALSQSPELDGVARYCEDTRLLGVEPSAPPARWSRLSFVEEQRGAAPITAAARPLGGEIFAYIFTSGTTGLPKAGKILNVRAIVAGLGFGNFTLGLGRDDVVYVCLPLFHANGLLVGVGSAITAGATVSLAKKLSVSRFWDDVANTRATAFVYIGEICRYLVAAPPHPKERAHRLRCIVGNGMRPEVWQRFADRFAPGIVHEFYGATEGNINMTNLLGVEGSVGRMPPLPGVDNAFLARFDRDREIPVRDAKGRCIACKTGEVGELLGRIDDKYVTSRFDGYLGDEATQAKILRNVREKGDAYFRSGDLMKKDLWGFYYFVDRIGDTFRWKGENVATNEVQDALGSFDTVESANVYGVEVPGFDGRAGMAALALKPGAHFAPQSFYEHALRSLPAYAVPAFVRLLAQTELTATFKLKKVDLQRDGYDPKKTEDLVFYRDDQTRSYEVIDEAAYERLQRGEIRL